MLFTFVKSSFSQLISGAYCTRPRNRAPGAAGTPAGNHPHADRTRSAAPSLRSDSRHTWCRPATTPCLPECSRHRRPLPPAPTHPTRSLLLPFAHLLAFFSCYTVIFMLYNIFSATQQRKTVKFLALLVNNSIS